MQLNSWEKDEYKGDGWIKFKGKDGSVTGNPKDDSGVQQGSGAGVEGYLNVKTNQITFIVDYNMMKRAFRVFLTDHRQEPYQQLRSRVCPIREGLGSL